jgi:hypothetical protein
MGLWLAPVAAAMTVWIIHGGLPVGVWLWPKTSVEIRFSLVLLGPLIGGLAAWVAVRNRRGGIDELLATTPCSPPFRDLAPWMATIGWASAAYIAAAAYALGLTWRHASWGSPFMYLSPVLFGLLGLVAHSALGYVVGYYLPSRFVVPLVAVGLYLPQGVISGLNTPVQNLSPISDLESSVFYGVQPALGIGDALWLSGLAGIALGAVTLRHRRTLRSWSVTALAGLMAVSGAVMLLGTERGSPPASAAIPYQPVCAGSRVVACVHPAYRGMLPETARLADQLSRPLAGLPGTPSRLAQRAHRGELAPPDVVLVDLWDEARGYDDVALQIASGLVRDERASAYELQPDGPGGSEEQAEYETFYLEHREAQDVVITWLVRAGGREGVAQGLVYTPEGQAALERFVALKPEDRSAWLRARYADLRAGKLGVEDLP